MATKPLLGVIADDFTGASDMASFLVKGGMSCIQINNLASIHKQTLNSDAIVLALKTRTVAVEQALEQSLQALDFLLEQGCQYFYFKYCSTFDSTAKGNIGPVIDALLARLNLAQAIICPALPANGRTVYQGHLFVYQQLLSDSPLKDHPLTPMDDSRVAELLRPQVSTAYQQAIEHLSIDDLNAKQLNPSQQQARYLICDCINQQHLSQIAQLIAQQPAMLLTGGSGLAEYMAQLLTARGHSLSQQHQCAVKPLLQPVLIIAGSCSKATREQIAEANALPQFCVDPVKLAKGELKLKHILDWIHQQQAPAVLVYSSQAPEQVSQTQQLLGQQNIAEKIENLLAQTAVQSKASNIVVAGGETSGAVVSALNISSFNIGPSICPGVPIMQSNDQRAISLALKSGNFGDKHFFNQALSLIQQLGAQA
ncbi:3-oxo-tetronate kinase [Agarivorans aestuarii]|uniref:3-oxo-tetronate kinase n=1 Tax=Agarivorans aestuarii TaxID=1563703 RepID=UPI001C80B57D|nr:3-oxo-tetronate kinase [Agarivorans aestuarii]